VAAEQRLPGTQKAGSMRAHSRSLIPFAIAAVLATAACGESGSSGTGGDSGGDSASGSTCAPVEGDQLVMLEDDKKRQTVDNIVPAVAAPAQSPALLDALNAVSAALTTEQLVELVAAVDLERQGAVEVATAYVEENGLGEGVSGGSGAITVGGGNFTESQILANIYADVLNAAGFQATVQSVGNREAYLGALQRNEIQVFPEYVGTVATFLNGKINGPDAEPVASSDLDETLANLNELAPQAGLVFGEPSEAADQNAFAVNKALADELGVTTLSELAEACGDGSLVLGGPPECPERPFCQPGLEETYGMEFASVEDLDIGAPTNQALQQGVVSIGLVLSTDPVLAQG
jgi:osmoprotectant transport system substrate-binding protein